MIEVQILDAELYASVKPLASYASDLTHVCAFRDSLASKLIALGVDVAGAVERAGKSRLESRRKPMLTIVDGKVIKVLKNPEPELLAFLGVRSEFDPTVPVRYMQELKALLDAGLVDFDEKFDQLYSHLGYRDKIEGLVCSGVRFQGKGKLVDHVDGSLTVLSLHLADCKIKDIHYKQMRVHVLKPPEGSKDGNTLVDMGRYSELKCAVVNKNSGLSDVDMVIRFHVRPMILNSIAVPGNEFNIACGKIQELDDEGYVLTTSDPIILPEGLEWKKVEFISPPNRSVPADLYRNAYHEFMLRYDDQWRKRGAV